MPAMHASQPPATQAHRGWVGRLIATLLLAAGTAGAAEPPALNQPAGTKLSLLSRDAAQARARYAGSTAVHGILVAQWLPTESGPAPLARRFQLLLVAASAAHLPHFAGHRLTHLDLGDGMQLLSDATSPAIAEEFADMQRIAVHVEGIFVITDLQLGGACLAAGQARVEMVDPIRVRTFPKAEPITCRAG
jgi:hypothetical protein